MKKLIVKSLLKKPEFFERRAGSVGMEFAPAIWQHERVYLPHDFRPKMNYPRMVLRTEVKTTDEPAEYALYLKRHIEDSGVDVVDFTTVGNYTEASAIVHQLGFRKVAEISRQRRVAELDDKTMIYLDTLEGLNGTFVKIEVILNDGVSVAQTREEMLEMLRLFGQDTFLLQTYADLMREQMQPYSLL